MEKISMIKYDSKGNPIDVAHGLYNQRDILIFRRDGFVDVDEELAIKTDEILAQQILGGLTK